MKKIFTDEYIEHLSKIFGEKVYLSLSDDEASIYIDWQSNFVVVKSKSNGNTIYDFYYEERGSRTKYDRYSSERRLKKGLERHLHNVF